MRQSSVVSVLPDRTVTYEVMKFSVAYLLFCVTWITMFNNAQFASTEDVLDKIKIGLQHASNYLETAKDIADLVSKNLGNKQKQKRGEDGHYEAKPPFGPSNIVSAFFRLIGLDSSKIGAIAINGVIFLAQTIGSLFGMTRPQGNIGRNINDEGVAWDPLKFILENKNEKVRDLVNQARNTNLSNRLIAAISGADLACVKLLLCKSSPIIKAAQNSINNKSQADKYRITAWLPSKEEFEINSDQCEDEYTDCSLFATRQ